MLGTETHALFLHLKVLATELETLLHDSGKYPSSSQVHQLRVLIRRIRLGFELFEEQDATPRLKRLGKALGRRRDLEVALADEPEFETGRKQLRRDKKKASLRLTKRLAGSCRKKVLRETHEALDALGRRKVTRLGKGYANIRNGLSRTAKAPSRSAEALHEFRIALRKARYALEALGKPVDPLVRLQDHLGRAHDLQLLRDLTHSSPKLDQAQAKEVREAMKLKGSVIPIAARRLKL